MKKSSTGESRPRWVWPPLDVLVTIAEERARTALQALADKGVTEEMLGRLGPYCIEMHESLDGRAMPRDWAVAIDDTEAVIDCVPLTGEHVGAVAVIAPLATLPRPTLDDDARERIAGVLADLVLDEGR